MAQQDLAGLLTGITQAPIDPMAGASMAQRQLAMGAQAAQGLRQGMGGLFNTDTRTTKEKADQLLASLDVNDVNDQEKILQIVSNVNPQAAPLLKAQFAQQARVRAKEGVAKTQQTAQRENFAKYLDKTYVGRGYGALALQGTLTPANMKNFIKETAEGKADNTWIDSVDPEGNPTNALVSNSSGEVIKTLDREGNPTDKVNTEFQNIMVDGQQVKALINTDNGAIMTTYGLPLESGNLTNEQLTYNAIVASNEANNLPSPTWTNWRKGEIAEKNMSPKRREYLELKEAAGSDVTFPAYAEWYNKQDLETIITTDINQTTGIGTERLTNAKTGEVIEELGVTSMPTLTIQENADKTYSVYNSVTGIMGEPRATKESAGLQQKAFYATMAAINAIDGTLGALSEAQRLKGKGPDGEAVGGVEYLLLNTLPETDARLLKSKVKTIQANLAFGKLEQMKMNSSTGASGLGQVSNLELDLLKAAVGALDPLLGVEAFNDQVVLIAKHYNRFKQALLEQADYVTDPKTGDIFVQSPVGKTYRIGTQAQAIN
tara:strand:+ start:645 stop:2282 length:1638 start_codon:yes stop_codon:yes gene_type:complete